MLYRLSIACIVHPSISRIRFRMAFQVEYFYDAIPDRFPIEYFLHWPACMVRSLPAVEFMNRVSEFVNVTHAAASSKSPTPQTVPVPPAAIAGVHRRVL